MPQNVFAWLDEKIDQCIHDIDNDNSISKNIKLLDSLISIRKKYEGSLDRNGEKIRVMEEFILFVINNYKKDISKIELICKDFLSHDKD